MGLFKCKHPFEALVVFKEHTSEIVDAVFERIDYHLFCVECDERLTIKHFRLVQGCRGGLTKCQHKKNNARMKPS